MKKILKYSSIILMLVLGSVSAFAQADLPELLNSNSAIQDYTNTLNRNEIASLDSKLKQFTNQTSTALVIAIVPDLNGYDVVEYADMIGDKWKIGQAGKDNGILIVVKPKTRSSQGRVRISVGYGLEGAVPDAITKRIIENEMIPHFQRNDYYSALMKSTDVLIDLTKGEYTADEYANKSGSNRFGFLVPLFAILFFFFFSRISGRRERTYGSSNLPLWTLLFMGSSMGRGSHHGSWNNFSGGSGNFGGGGFGGFGGGSFGGGGASGSW